MPWRQSGVVVKLVEDSTAGLSDILGLEVVTGGDAGTTQSSAGLGFHRLTQGTTQQV
jgi:hypothetical protein